jgi:T5orf172 domain
MADELAVFQDRIRRIWHQDEWWFSVVDVVEILTDSPSPRQYWGMLKKRLADEGADAATMCVPFQAPATDGKMRFTDFAKEGTLQAITRNIPARRRKASRYVYAIQAVTGGPVKIGRAKDVVHRLEQLQNCCPLPLRIIWHKAGVANDEEILHAHFADRRQHGEWFDLQGLDIPHELDAVLAGHVLKETRAS